MRILLDAIKLKYLSNLAGSSTNSTQAKHRIAQVIWKGDILDCLS